MYVFVCICTWGGGRVCQWVVDAVCVDVFRYVQCWNVGLWLVEACFISVESKDQQMLLCLSGCVCVCVSLLGSVFGFFVCLSSCFSSLFLSYTTFYRTVDPPP